MMLEKKNTEIHLLIFDPANYQVNVGIGRKQVTQYIAVAEMPQTDLCLSLLSFLIKLLYYAVCRCECNFFLLHIKRTLFLQLLQLQLHLSVK